MKTIEHLIPKAINPQALLDAVERAFFTVQTGKLGHGDDLPGSMTHSRLIFWVDDFPSQAAQDELAGFVAGYVAAWQDAQEDKLDAARWAGFASL